MRFFAGQMRNGVRCMADSGYQAGLQIQPGFASGDIWMSLAEEEHAFFEVLELSLAPYLEETEETRTCRQWYRESGRARSVHGAFADVNPASGDERFRELSRRRCIESCALAEQIGAGNVVFHSSCATFLRGTYMDQWAGLCADFYEELADRSGLNLWIENSQDIDAHPLRELMKRIRDPRIGICLDLGHANYSRMCMEEWFEILGDRIGYLHLSDNFGYYDDHVPREKEASTGRKRTSSGEL